MASIATSNFRVLEQHDAQLMRPERLAERFFADDPNTCLLKLRQLTEGLAQLVASKVGVFNWIKGEEAFLRLDKLLQGQFQHVLDAFNDALCHHAAGNKLAWQCLPDQMPA